MSNDPVNAVDPLGLLVCFLTYESVTVPATIDGEDGVAIISIAHQLCFGGWGGGGGGQTSIGGDLGGGGGGGRPDKNDRAMSGMLNICGTAATVGQYSNVNAAGTAWKGPYNGKWNDMSWGGNGSTGARALAKESARVFSRLSRAAGVFGAAVSFHQSGIAFSRGHKAEGAKFALDGGMGLAGAFGGPYGAAASAVYFGIDMTIGWEGLGQEVALTRCDAECQ